MDYYIIESMPLLARNTDTQVSIGCDVAPSFCGDMSCFSIHHLSYIILYSIPCAFFIGAHMLSYYHIQAFNIYQVYLYFTIYRQYFLLKFEQYHAYLIQQTLKSGGTKDHFRQVKVPGTAFYWKTCMIWRLLSLVWQFLKELLLFLTEFLIKNTQMCETRT